MVQEIANSTLLDTWGSSGAKIEPDISKIIEGWQLGEQPPHEYMNWLQNTFGSKLNHILKNGVANWNNTTQYLAGSSVQHNGNVWLCETKNTNSAPTDANADWKRIITVGSLTTVLNGYVKNSGDETIEGIKTFSSFPVSPLSAPTADYQMANKKYVEDYFGTQTNSIPFNESGWSFFQGFKNNGILAITNVDANTLNSNSTYFHTGTINVPEQYGVITTFATGAPLGTDRLQIFYPSNKSIIYIRMSNNTGGATWTPWKNISQSVGIDQTYQNVTASRASGVTYTNSTLKPIYVKIICQNTNIGGGIEINLIVNGTTVDTQVAISTNPIEILSVSAIIPPDSTYSYTQTLGDTFTWYELR